MKRFILTLTIAALLAPGLSFAQTAPSPNPKRPTSCACSRPAGLAALPVQASLC